MGVGEDCVDKIRMSLQLLQSAPFYFFKIFSESWRCFYFSEKQTLLSAVRELALPSGTPVDSSAISHTTASGRWNEVRVCKGVI